jgi:hypothetical protein
MSTPLTNPKATGGKGRHGARATSRTKYARARIGLGLTYQDLRDRLGCSFATVAAADKGALPRHPAIRAAYLAAIGLTEKATS